jgi:hypothetical protein
MRLQLHSVGSVPHLHTPTCTVGAVDNSRLLILDTLVDQVRNQTAFIQSIYWDSHTEGVTSAVKDDRQNVSRSRMHIIKTKIHL